MFKSDKGKEPVARMEQRPLSDRMRPRDLADFYGQAEIIGPGRLLRELIEGDDLSSLIFWGPPGVGKTTLARIIAARTKSDFVILSGVMSGKEDLKQAVVEAEAKLAAGRRTVLFIDEVHRWNKAQQDALLPYVEKGLITLIGATTENPSFEIIGALLSRTRVFVLKRLDDADVVHIIQRALTDNQDGLGGQKIIIDDAAINFLAELAAGDARVALNGLEIAVRAARPAAGGIKIDKEKIKEALQKTHLIFDKQGEEFYNVISALHKSMRGGDADAALYWLARMLEGGADPLYVARRVLRFASEDIGMANSEALVQANAAYDAAAKIGLPECSVHLAQAVVYCAKSSKSNLLYVAYEAAATEARRTSQLGVPLHLRNAPTKLMKDIGYGKDYKYNPDFAGPVEQDYLPPELKGKKYLKK